MLCLSLRVLLLLLSAAALESFERAVSLHRARQAGATQHNEARATKRQQLLELQGQPGESEAQALLEELGEDEEVVPVPAKLLNNAAVLKYRCGRGQQGAWDGQLPVYVCVVGGGVGIVWEGATGSESGAGNVWDKGGIH